MWKGRIDSQLAVADTNVEKYGRDYATKFFAYMLDFLSQ